MSFIPYSVPNSRLTPQDMGVPDLLAAIQKGFQTANMPKQLAADLLARQLQNKINQPKADYAKDITLADLAHTQAQTGYLGTQVNAAPLLNQLRQAQINAARFKEQNPLMGATGAAGQIAAALYLQQHPELNNLAQGSNDSADSAQGAHVGDYVDENGRPVNSDVNYDVLKTPAPDFSSQNNQSAPGFKKPNFSEQILQGLKTAEQQKSAAALYQNKRAGAYAYSTAPANVKNYMLAQAAGMGIDPYKAVTDFANGKTIEDLARENGFEPDNLPEPDYLPQNNNITKVKDRQAALAEMKSLSKTVTDWVGPKSKSILGWSVKQTLDQLRGKDPESQAKFIAGRGIIPELTNMRLLASGARGTVHAIKSMQDKALFNIKSIESFVNPKVWARAQQLMDEKIEEALNKSQAAYHLKSRNDINAAREKNTIQASQATFKGYIRDPKTNVVHELEIPVDEKNDFLKNGGSLNG